MGGFRNNGGCPCPRCLVEKGDLAKLNAPTDNERYDMQRSEEKQRELVDLAREEITAGFAVDGKRIDAHLKSQSLVPVHVSCVECRHLEQSCLPDPSSSSQNSFASRLSQINFKVIAALAVDLLHEFEIGVWKKLFIHLIRLLVAFSGLDRQGPTLTAVLDFRSVQFMRG